MIFSKNDNLNGVRVCSKCNVKTNFPNGKAFPHFGKSFCYKVKKEVTLIIRKRRDPCSKHPVQVIALSSGLRFYQNRGCSAESPQRLVKQEETLALWILSDLRRTSPSETSL